MTPRPKRRLSAPVVQNMAQGRFGRTIRWMAFKSRPPDPPSMEEVRKRAQILVVDDEFFPYIDSFQRDNYHITKWSHVENMTQLTENHFDLILLDLNGIAPRDAPTMQGLEVLKHIRDESPVQMVIAYSGQKWGVEAQQFLSYADDVLDKSEDYLVFKGKVDTLLRRRYSPGYFLGLINREIGDRADRVPNLVPITLRAIGANKPDTVRNYLRENLIEQVTIDRIIAVLGIAIALLRQ